MKLLCDKYRSICVNFLERVYLAPRWLNQFSAKQTLFMGTNRKLAQENAWNDKGDCANGLGKMGTQWSDAKRRRFFGVCVLKSSEVYPKRSWYCIITTIVCAYFVHLQSHFLCWAKQFHWFSFLVAFWWHDHNNAPYQKRLASQHNGHVDSRLMSLTQF